VKLYVNGRQVGETFVERFAPQMYEGTLGIGQGFGSPVSSAVPLPFRFTGGKLNSVIVQLK
jgi:hypothetical protein